MFCNVSCLPEKDISFDKVRLLAFRAGTFASTIGRYALAITVAVPVAIRSCNNFLNKMNTCDFSIKVHICCISFLKQSFNTHFITPFIIPRHFYLYCSKELKVFENH